MEVDFQIAKIFNGQKFIKFVSNFVLNGTFDGSSSEYDGNLQVVALEIIVEEFKNLANNEIETFDDDGNSLQNQALDYLFESA